MKKLSDKRPGLHQLPPAIDCGSGYSWLPFFLMALGTIGSTVQAQEQVLRNYYWVLPQQEPVHSTRVIKVTGEKGEKYDEVLSDVFPIQNHAIIQQARLNRLRALRLEATELASRFKEAGKTPEVAYEDAWTQVYTRTRLSANGGEGRKRLDFMLRQLADGKTDLELSDSDAQWLLEALIEDDSRLDSEEGRLLLRKLSERLRVNGSELSQEKYSAQDELMHTFANSLVFCEDSMDAYRDALFKVNRGFIMNHPLVGYRAPWGMGLSRSKAVYQQAKNPTPTQTISSANTQAQTVPFENLHVGGDEKQTSENISAGLDPDAGKIENFLATSPLLPEEDEQDESKKELDEREETDETEKGASAAAPAPPLMMMRSFSLRSVAAPVSMAVDEPAPQLTWTGSGSTTWVAGNSVTPWTMNGSATSFQNGDNVLFNESGVRNVSISGVVAPGQITVSTSEYASTLGGGIIESDSWWQDMLGGSNVNAQMKYGYAFVGTDMSCIADVSASQATSMEINGGTVVVLNTANTFTGGVTVRNGALYLGCDDAAGSGNITLYNDSSWTRYFNTGEGSSFDAATWAGSELMVNYKTGGASYVAANVDNHLVLAGNQDGSGRVSISFGLSNFEETASPSAAGRMLSLTGGIEGKGDLFLFGYSSASASAENNVSNFAINQTNYTGTGAYSGTVHLMNSFNNSHSDERAWMQGYLLGGAVQLTLQDDVFAGAVINMTREVGDNDVGWNKFIFWSASEGGIGKSMTSDNILSMGGDVTLKGLEASFTNAVWRHKANTYRILWVIPITLYDTIRATCAQTDERWRVRVVTDSMATLTLDDDSSTTHQYDGSVGFAQSYVQPGQYRINEYDASATDASFKAGSGTLGLESSLNLVKRGSASQYIHSARLNTLSVQQGTIGFNHLDISGYLNLTSGTTLQLGVTKDSVSSTGWDNITKGDYKTNSEISIKSGKELLVIAADDGGKSIDVQGSITMETGSDIMFSVLLPEPSWTQDSALLKLTGSLTLQDNDIPINVNFSSVEFAKDAAGKTYYLASADSGITVDGKSASNFTKRFIPLGHGYYGILSMEEEDSSSKDYLIMTVSGDPRRTWSGNVGNRATNKGIWTASATDALDYTWKENHNFMQGQVVLFGNLFQPTAWQEGEWGASSTTTTIVGDTLHPGTTGEVTIDSLEQSGFQLVKIVGDVAPASVAINADALQHDLKLTDNTNYYFHGSGYIRDALNSEIKLPYFNSDDKTPWQTYLRKGGSGTAVISTANTYSGGSVLEGGRLVMQNKSALGTGEITIQNGAMLQGDFADDRSTGTWSSAYTGEGMTTTTINNPVYVAIFISEDGTVSPTEVDGRLIGAHDKKLVLSELRGGPDTVLTLTGNSADPETTDTFTYSVFKVLDPGAFYGTVKMDGNLHGATSLYEGGGKVQMEIMTTEKATGGGNWLNTKVDLSITQGTVRTVLALDALGTQSASAAQVAQIAALQGVCDDGSRINSSVLSMSTSKSITLEIIGSRNGDYDGVLGFGDFQKTVDYNSTQADIGKVQHHFGRSEKGLGTLSVHKLGGSFQSVNSAWLQSLEVGSKSANAAGGRFLVDSALVVADIQTADSSRISIGSGVENSMYALAVGAGGVLAMDTSASVDAFAGIGAGIPATVELVPDSSSQQQGALKEQGVAPSAFILFDNGATITAFGDWKTTQRTGTATPKQGITVNYTVTTDIAHGATVTFNTHNYTPDEYITESNDVFGCYNSSHAIQLLGDMRGSNVHLMFNNELISAAAVKDGSATKRTDGLGYDGVTGTQMGYVAIRDIHQFTGDITVEGMTTLQVTNTNSSAASDTANIDITVQGANAALQFTDTVTDQYINNLVLKNGGHVLIGGVLKNTTSAEETTLDMSSVETAVTHRGAETASITNLNMKDSGTQVELGGTAAETSVVTNAAVSTTGTATNLKIHQTELHNSMVQLHSACSLDLTEAVLVDKNSAVQGAAVQNAVISAAELQGPLFPTEAENEVTTSAATVVQLTLTNTGQTFTDDGTGNKVLVLQMNQFQGVNVTGSGLTLQLTEQSAHFLDWGYNAGAQYVAIQVSGGSGWFLFEERDSGFASEIDNYYKLMGSDGVQITGTWVTSTTVGTNVSTHLLYFNVPEPTTTTLSLAALVALCARRRRR